MHAHMQHTTLPVLPRTYEGTRESVLFIGTPFSNLYTAVDTPAEATTDIHYGVEVTELSTNKQSLS